MDDPDRTNGKARRTISSKRPPGAGLGQVPREQRSADSGSNSPCSSGAQELRDPKRHLERLATIEPRIARGLVRTSEIAFAHFQRAAQTLGDVFTGHLEVDTTEDAAFVGVDRERALELAEDGLHPPRLSPRSEGLGVAMHGVATPQHGMTGGEHRT